MVNVGSAGNQARNELLPVGTTSIQAFQPIERTVYTVMNSSTGGQLITLNLGFAPAISGAGIQLSPGQAWIDSNGEGYTCFQGVITAISSAPGGQLSIMEKN